LPHDEGPASQHAGRISGMPARERLLIVGILGLIVAALVLGGLESLGQLATADPQPSPASPVAAAFLPSAAAQELVRSPPPEPSLSELCPLTPLPTEPWRAIACQRRGALDQIVEYSCPAGGSPGFVWGDLVYTDDSSVCSAAVHAGAITAEAGGTVPIRIGSGMVGYVGTTRNGVTSSAWARWPGSFSIEGSSPPASRDCTNNGDADDVWHMAPCPYRGTDGMVLSYDCSPDGRFAATWGDGFYTDDSSVCTAAVHAGAISREVGGSVRIAIRRGQDAYASSTRNGVKTDRWDAWPGSFEVLLPPTAR
jgi:hypothetical protein